MPADARLCSALVIRRLLLILLFPAVVRAAPVSGPGGSDLTARQTVFDQDDNAVVFTGEARLTDGHTLLEADEIRYQYATDTAIASGNVRLTRGAERVLADRITYHRRDHTFTVEHVRLGRFPYYISGKSAQGDRDRITVHDARLTVREPGPWQPTVAADSLSYLDNAEVVAENAHLGVGGVRPLSLPHFAHRLDLPLVSYLSLSAGYRASLGAFGELGAHVPFGPDTKLGATLGVYTARGVMFGPSGHYDLQPDGHEVTGDLRSGFINDHGDKQVDVLGRPVPENRGYVQWWHAQDLTDQLRITAQLNYWKDSEVLRDFKPQTFFNLQEPDNYLQAVYTAPNYFVTAFARPQPNDFQRVPQRLPEVRFDLMPVALPQGFFERFNASAAVLREETPGGAGPTTRSTRLDTYYALSRPVNPRDWFNFTPVAGARVTYYDRATGGRDNYTRVLGEFGFDATLRTSAVYDYRNETWKIDGIRHLLTPKVSYRYIPGADQGRAYIPAIDTRTFSTYLPPLGLGDTRNLDDLAPTNVLRVGLDNTWQTRDPQYGSRDLLVFNLANDFRFSREAGERRTSDLHAALSFMPASWLQFDLYQRLAPQDFTLEELNTGLSIHDGNAWAVRLYSNFLRHQIEEYVLQYDLRLNEAYGGVARLRYDQLTHRFNEQALGLRQNLGNTWKIEYLVTLYDGPRRESNFGFSINVETLGF